VVAGSPGQIDREVHHPPVLTGHRGGDAPLRRGILIAEHDPADPVRDRLADPRGSDGVERVHGPDQPEAGTGGDHAEPGDGDLALGQHGNEDVQRLLGDPVELLQVQQGTVAHGLQQRAVGETARHVAVRQHLRGVVLAHQPGRGQLGVALDEDDALAGLPGDVAQQRGLAGAGRPLDHHVPPGAERHGQNFALPPQPNNCAAVRLLNAG
jgi:hypothetical protein